MHPRVLFILKRNQGSGGANHTSSGLKNSAKYVVDMLIEEYIAYAELVQVFDGNGIDREVYLFQPDIVVLEAIWCPPSKLLELSRLWPKVQWVVRIHSEIPFLANEGLAIEWIDRYLDIRNVVIASNSPRGARDLAQFKAIFLPNYYPLNMPTFPKQKSNSLRVGCFGAIRPMKNQLAQAFAAIAYAKAHHYLALEFYVNSTRCEQGGEQVYKNLRALFAAQPPGYRLIPLGWAQRDQFRRVVSDMDVSLNVSLSETYCITAADAASQHIPIVVSREVPWASDSICADPNDISDISSKMGVALGWRRNFITHGNFHGLHIYNRQSIREWSDALG